MRDPSNDKVKGNKQLIRKSQIHNHFLSLTHTLTHTTCKEE